MNYFDHNNLPGSDIRYALMASREARARFPTILLTSTKWSAWARYLEALREYDSGDITLYMSKYDLQRRLQEAKDAP